MQDHDLSEYYRQHPTVFSYFEDQPGGAQFRWYYEVCWETVKAWNPNSVLLSREMAESIVGPFPAAVNSLYVAQRCDWVRKAVIAKVGGLWVDCDFICWTDLTPLAIGATAWDYVGYHEWGASWMDNFFGGRAGSPIIAELADHALGRAELHGKNTPWLDMSRSTLVAVLGAYPWHKVLRLPTHVVEPVDCSDISLFFKRCDSLNENRWWKTFGVITSAHGLGSRLRDFASADQLLDSDTWLAAILRRGLRGPISQPADRLELIREAVPVGGTMAEVGVLRGDFARKILDACKPATLHLIDTWDGQWWMSPNPSENQAGEMVNLNAAYKRLAAEYSGRDDVQLHRGLSFEQLSTLPNESLDAAYLDADHAEEAVTKDMEAAWPKIKPGGVMLGHDYDLDGVARGVRRFCDRHQVKLGWLTQDASPSWGIRKPTIPETSTPDVVDSLP